MKKKIKYLMPSESIEVKYNQYGDEVNHTYNPQNDTVRYAKKRINEFNEESKYFRGDDNILFTYEYKVKGKFNGRSYKSDKEYQIQVSTSHDNYNMKQLKIWKMYWDEGEYDWKYSRQGIVIPILHGKKFIKQIWEKLYGS